MSPFHLLLLVVGVLPATISAAPSGLASRAVIAHDAVVGFPTTVPAGPTGDLYRAYQPLLKVVNGCVPFPAVDAQGNTSGGLSPTGASDGGCSKSTGQVYVRSAVVGGRTGVMYSWYMPKDEPSTGIGHRHDWEGAVVWLASASSTAAANVLAVCPSAHGNFPCSTDGFTLGGSGTQPLIKYQSIWPVDHSLGLTDSVGGTQPLVAWESLPQAARDALENTDFGSGNVPFKDASFAGNLAKAAF